MNDHLDRIVRKPEQKMRLDDLERLVHQRRTVDRDLATHRPGRMLQSVGDSRISQALLGPFPKRSARGGEDHPANLAAVASPDTLQNGAVLAVHRDNLSTAVCRGFCHELTR